MIEPANAVVQDEQAATAAANDEGGSRATEWVLLVTTGLVAATALVWLVRLLADGGPDTAGDGMLQGLLAGTTFLAFGWSAFHRRRVWAAPAERLCRLTPRVRDGELPIEALSDVGGGVAPLTAVVQDLLRDLRRQRLAMADLEREVSQRVANRTDALERALGTMKQKATRDPLTGLYNRRMLDEHLPRLIERYASSPRGVPAIAADAFSDTAITAGPSRGQGPAGHATGGDGASRGLCLLMVDVDHFKLLNDTLGHHAGDDLLRSIGQLIRSAIREADLAFRYGGDEFVILLDDVDLGSGQALAARLVCLVDGLTKPLRVKHPPRLSIGVSHLDGLKDVSPAALMAEADRLLYEVKAARKRKT